MGYFLSLGAARLRMAVRALPVVLVTLFGAACSTLPQPEPVVMAAVKERQVSPAELKRQQVAQLLAAAERALDRGQLMLPYADNAYDRYSAVLLLQPGNVQAQSGLDDIAVRYVQMARTAISRSRWSEAETLIGRAREVNSENPLLSELVAEFERAQSNQVVGRTDNQYLLVAKELNENSEWLAQLLEEIVVRVKASGESLVIVARNDQQGRWLYKRLKQAAQGYRLRGDIQIGAQPKIIVLPPL